jgi:hypothetical protein
MEMESLRLAGFSKLEGKFKNVFVHAINDAVGHASASCMNMINNIVMVVV